jgi:type I restriction enzyme S subunit
MELKPGYKQTEVGVVPGDWRVSPIGALGAFKNGINKDGASFGRGSPFINLMDVFGVSKIESSDSLGLVATNSIEQQAYDLKTGDVIFIRSSVKPSGVGLTAVVEANLPNTVYSGFLIRFRDAGNLDTRFKRHCFYEGGFRRRLIGVSSVSANTNINQDNLKRLAVAFPPIKAEQEAIASALSDADALIESLDQLITKKRQIKQGSMQELLTGKRRLPGFSGEWKVKRLGSTATLKARIGWQGLTTSEYLESGSYHLVAGTEFKDGRVDWAHCHYVEESRYKQDRHIQLQDNDILVTKDGTIGKVALVKEMPLPATLNSGVFVIRPVSGAFHPEFFYYLLCFDVFTEFLGQLSAGSTINHLYQKDFVSFVYRTPVTIEEQQAIATLLSDMDTELAALESRLAKARQIKQGMMQELLTGRIRLP